MLRNSISSILKALDLPVRIEPLVVFRIAFGGMMLFSTLRFVFLGWIDDHYIQPLFHFHYYGFSWVEPLAPWLMYGLHLLMVMASVGIILGYYFRLSSILFFLCFTYCELIDLSYYLNHYYFVSLVSGLIIFLPLHRFYSLDVYFGRVKSYAYVPAWTKYIVMLQMTIVYVFAGLAKINYDWLVLALPLKIWLPVHYDLPLLGFLFEYKITPYVFSWAGMLYDLSIPFLLFYRSTRPWAYMSVVFFHVLTGMLFQIGIFPLVMMSGTLLFFSDAFHQRILGAFKKAFFFIRKDSPEVQHLDCYTYPLRWQKLLLGMMAMHVFFQVIFPFRYLLYPGNLFWTEEGYRYSWRVMLMEKAGTATFYVKDAITGKEGAVINSDFLNLHQEKQMAMQPDMILEYAHFLAAHYKAQGMADPKVRAEVYVTLNARPSKLFIDPQLDLANVKDGWGHKTWIINDEK
jgi:hypothetical protein